MNRNSLFTRQIVLLTPLCIAANIFGAQLALHFDLPLFFDCIGTIVAGALGGLIPGVIVGFLTNAINSISDPITFYYGVINVLFGIMAALLSGRGVFLSWRRSLLAALLFALVGGVLGSLMTWGIYGLNVGEGVSAGFVSYLCQQAQLPAFAAQLTADFIIDLADKLLSLTLVFIVLHLLPAAFLRGLPLGGQYCRATWLPTTQKQSEDTLLLELEQLLAQKKAPIRFSLSTKVMLLIGSTALIISVLALTISYIIYKDISDERYVELCRGASVMAASVVDGDQVELYLRGRTDTEEYQHTELELSRIRASFSGVEYVYVYQIRPDGCHVVFDVDTETLPGEQAGTILPFDDTFAPYVPALLNGERIDPIESNDRYGWLLSAYEPIFDSQGNCVAYAAADVLMNSVISDRYMYLMRMIALLLGATSITACFAMWFAQQRLVRPINALAVTSGSFAYNDNASRQKSAELLRSLDIRTGDELQNLYETMTKLVADLGEYVREVDEQSADIAEKAQLISRMQDNIIYSFAEMIESRDENTGCHVKRTSAYVNVISAELRRDPRFAPVLSDEYCANLRRSAPLHDIGKIKVPDAILNKPGKLTPEEFDAIKQHTVAGGSILSNALVGIEGESYLSEAVEVATYHHERWDGNGYPEHLRGAAIPLSARIMAVADVFDALISKRSYKEAMSFDQAVEIIRSEAGTHFDPDVVQAFLRAQDTIRQLSEQ